MMMWMIVPCRKEVKELKEMPSRPEIEEETVRTLSRIEKGRDI